VEKNFICGIIVTVSLALVGCGSRPAVIATDDALIEAQRSADRLQTIHDGLGGILQFHDNWIRESIDDAVGGIDRAFELLDEYDVFVQSLIARIRELYALVSDGERAETDP